MVLKADAFYQAFVLYGQARYDSCFKHYRLMKLRNTLRPPFWLFSG